jgi:hypothetical protein
MNKRFKESPEGRVYTKDSAEKPRF